MGTLFTYATAMKASSFRGGAAMAKSGPPLLKLGLEKDNWSLAGHIHWQRHSNTNNKPRCGLSPGRLICPH